MLNSSHGLRLQARRLYVETNVPVETIALRVGRTARTIQAWARDEDWPRRRARPRPRIEPASQAPATSSRPLRPRERRRPSIGTLSLHQRCCRLFDQFLSSLEDRMNSDDPFSDPLSERDVRALGGFSRAIEKIKEIEPGPSPDARADTRHGAAASHDEEDRLRRELVDRLLKLRERKRAESARGGSGGNT